MFLARNVRKAKSGARLTYFVLRDSYWDKKLKRQRHRYVCYLGAKPTLSPDKARKLARKLKIGLAELGRIKGLKITE